jgi:hypothetical protein
VSGADHLRGNGAGVGIHVVAFGILNVRDYCHLKIVRRRSAFRGRTPTGYLKRLALRQYHGAVGNRYYTSFGFCVQRNQSYVILIRFGIELGMERDSLDCDPSSFRKEMRYSRLNEDVGWSRRWLETVGCGENPSSSNEGAATQITARGFLHHKSDLPSMISDVSIFPVDNARATQLYCRRRNFWIRGLDRAYAEN